MLFPYYYMLVATSMVLGAIVSARLSFIMGSRWQLSYKRGEPGPLGFLQFFCAVGTAIVCGLATSAAMEFGGWKFGILADVLTIPFVSFVWIFIVGGNQVTTRLLAGILVKVDSVEVDR